MCLTPGKGWVLVIHMDQVGNLSLRRTCNLLSDLVLSLLIQDQSRDGEWATRWVACNELERLEVT